MLDRLELFRGGVSYNVSYVKRVNVLQLLWEIIFFLLTFIEYQPVPVNFVKYTFPAAATEIRFNSGISCENDII